MDLWIKKGLLIFSGLIIWNLKLNLCLNISVLSIINDLFRNKDSNRWFSSCANSCFYSKFFKGKFGIKTGLGKDTFVKEEPVKIIELKGKVVKEGKAKAIKEISNKLDSIEQKADEVFEKVKKIRKIKRRKKE